MLSCACCSSSSCSGDGRTKGDGERDGTNKGDGERDGVVIGKGDRFRAVRFLSLARRRSDLSETFIVLEASLTLELDQGIRQYMHVFNNTKLSMYSQVRMCALCCEARHRSARVYHPHQHYPYRWYRHILSARSRMTRSRLNPT